MGKDAKTTTTSVAGESLELLSERAIFWPRTATLIVSDLHWGKPETFQARGIQMPSDVLDEDLSRLSSALLRTKATRLIVLGDLIHSRIGLTANVVEKVTAWRTVHDIEFVLIRGNHDMHVKDLPRSWKVSVVDGTLTENPFVFSHFPEKSSEGFVWAGHIHPMVRLNSGNDSLRLPCFCVKDSVGLVPAFSSATGGYDIKRSRDTTIFVVAKDEVIQV